MTRMSVLLCVASMLAACASQPAPTDPTASSAAPASATTNALAGTPMATYGHALNRAKDVQNIVNDQAKKQAKAVDEATGSH